MAANDRNLMQNRFAVALDEHQRLFARLSECLDDVDHAARRLQDTLLNGGKILLCGNGGSAADAQHAATELVVRYRRSRRALAAIALTTDTSILTASGNDYGFETLFARQVEALGRPGDSLIAISTSGQSPNICRAAQTARDLGVSVIGLTGEGGGVLAPICDIAVCVPSTETARVQEAHIFVLHVWCDAVERYFG